MLAVYNTATICAHNDPFKCGLRLEPGTPRFVVLRVIYIAPDAEWAGFSLFVCALPPHTRTLENYGQEMHFGEGVTRTSARNYEILGLLKELAKIFKFHIFKLLLHILSNFY